MDTDQNFPDVSTSTPDEKDNGIGPKHIAVERVLRLLLLLLVNECTRLEIFERLAPYYKVDDNVTGRVSSSRRADRMFERDIKLLKYGDQAELIEPTKLREQMRQVVAR